MKLYKFLKICTSLLCLIAFLSCQQRSSESDLELETDDRELSRTSQLIDMSKKVEGYVNNIIDSERKKLKISEFSSEQDIEQFIENTKISLTKEVEGSGIDFLVTELSPLVQIEVDMNRILQEKQNEILHIDFKNSKYSENQIGVIKGNTFNLKFLSTANKSIAPIIRLGDTLIGTDKLAHFFEQGYWYYGNNLSEESRKKYGYYMEGSSELPEEEYGTYQSLMRKDAGRYLVYFGYFGAGSTGIISYADMNANEEGFKFYKRLEQDPLNYKFTFDDVQLNIMNESKVPNKHQNGILENRLNFDSGYLGVIDFNNSKRFNIFFCKNWEDFLLLQDNERIYNEDFGNCIPLFRNKNNRVYFIYGSETKELIKDQFMKKLGRVCDSAVSEDKDGCDENVIKSTEEIFSANTREKLVHVNSFDIPLLLRRIWEGIYEKRQKK